MILRPYQERYISKVREAFLQGFRAPCVVAPCGAGKSVIIGTIVKRTARRGNEVLFFVHRKELCDQIQETFEALEVPPEAYNIGMVQTVSRRLESAARPGLIITDENHHGLAASYRKIYDHFQDVPRLGFTATPIRLNGSGLGDVNDLLIEEVTARWLIDHEYLAPYKYYAPKLINEEHLKLSRIKDFSSRSIDEAIKENRTIYGDAIRHYLKLAAGQQAICYCHSVEASLEAAREFRDHDITAVHLDAKTPPHERTKIINDFRAGNIQVLTNVDLIGEGFDVPDCSAVILLRPTQSLSLYIQQSMRGMRYKPGKTSIIIDHVGNVHRHGLPDQERAWSLKPIRASSASITIRTCSSCFSVFAANMRACPMCGYMQPVNERPRELEADLEATLEEITEEKKYCSACGMEHDKNFLLCPHNKEGSKIIIDYREPQEARDMNDLRQIAENRKYKAGWIYHQAKLRGWI